MLLVLCILISASAASGKALNGVEILQGEWKGEPVEYLEGEILVGLKAGFEQQTIERELGSLEVEIVRNADRFGFMKFRVKEGADLFATIEELSSLASVRYAEPNMVDQMYVLPNDPMFAEQWHYHNTGQVPPGGTVDADIDAPEGWDISTGGVPIRVGVLDSGIPMQAGQLSHPDLNDPTRFFLGYDFSYGDTEPADDNGHGTHVSGTIAAESNNSTGVAGVCWNAEILAIKVFDQYGSGSHENFRDGCIYATDNGCKVINYSGGGTAGSAKEHGVAYADSHGVIVCAAAGNNWQGSVSWPGAYSTTYSNVICVSATDHNDESSPFSSIGPEVTISAPGGYGSPFDEDDIISTFPNYEVQLNVDYGLPQDYSPLAGTSMATPHVSGFAALILSLNPSMSPDSVRQIMINTSDDLGPAGFDNQFGWGRINVYNALSQLGPLLIIHDPLPDTKDSLNDYSVECQIISDDPLNLDSLFLRYEISSIWYEETLQPTGETYEYQAFIPAQSPGTRISYYIYAQNAGGDIDSTDTYTFRIIDYAASVAPEFQAGTAAVGDTVWYSIWVKNEGIYTDTYNVYSMEAEWNTTIWDAEGLVQISQVGPIVSDDSVEILAGVEVPVSLYGDVDSALVIAQSTGDPLVTGSAAILTVSAGQPFAIPFFDDFPTSEVNVGKWVEYYGVTISELGLNEPSPMYSLNLNGDPTGADTIMSQAIDLSGETSVVLSYYYEQTGGGDSPEAGDDLRVQYINSSASWALLNEHLGSDPDMLEFEEVEITLPPDAYHSGFRLRFVSTGTSGAYDDWFVDDVFVGLPSDYDVAIRPIMSSQYGPAGDSTLFYLYVHNKGLYEDEYDLTDSATTWGVSFWDYSNTSQIASTGVIQPADSLGILVKVVIPSLTPLNESDTVWIKATSQGDPNVTAYSMLEAISAGTAAVFPWYEPFPDPDIDLTRWMTVVGAEIATNAQMPPSPPYTVNLDGENDTIVSQLIDLAGQSGALLSYFYERTGPGESPDTDDDLVIEYRNIAGDWIEISRQLGDGADMAEFESVSLPLPSDALHGSFQLRLTTYGSGADYDDWFVDDLRIDYVPSIDVTPLSYSFSLQQGDSTDSELIVSNGGPGTLTYGVSVIKSFEGSAFENLFLGGMVAPSTHEYPEGYLDYPEAKGFDNEPAGVDIIFDAGGPDEFGYVWIDSDDPAGPSFDWIDIQTSGTEITGLDDDNFVGPIQIGFPFKYYGIEYTELYISSNGFIGFGPTDGYSSTSNKVMPTSTVPNNIVAWCWDDLDPTDTDNPDAKVLYQTDGSRFIIQFVSYPEFGGVAGDVIDAEVILTSRDEILLQYLSVAPGFDILGCSIGIEDTTGTDGLTVVFNSGYLHDSLALQFYSPAQWLEVGKESGNIPAGGADTLIVSVFTEDLDEGVYNSEIRIVSNDPDSAEAVWSVPVELTVSTEPPYVCGDADGNQLVDIDDVVFLINHIFAGGPAPDPPEAGDVDCSGAIDIDDAVYLIAYIFSEGPPPCALCP